MRLLFLKRRPTADVIANTVTGLVLLLCLVALYAVAQWVDSVAPRPEDLILRDYSVAEQAEARRVMTSVEEGLRARQLQAAYEAGLNDAMAAARHTPDVVALQQACLAVNGGQR